MTYQEFEITFGEYNDKILRKCMTGKISKNKAYRLFEKLDEWESVAYERLEGADVIDGY